MLCVLLLFLVQWALGEHKWSPGKRVAVMNEHREKPLCVSWVLCSLVLGRRHNGMGRTNSGENLGASFPSMIRCLEALFKCVGVSGIANEKKTHRESVKGSDWNYSWGIKGVKLFELMSQG